MKPFIVGLAGGSGSGKTTLAQIVASSLPWKTLIISLDRFYRDLSHLPLEKRAVVNFDHPDSIDVVNLLLVLEKLRTGVDAALPVYDFAEYIPTQQVEQVSAAPIILLEGMHTLSHLELCELYDLTVFLDIDKQTRWQRKLERDIRERSRTYGEVLRMWETHTKPMHNIHVHPNSTRANLLFTDTFAPEVIKAFTETIRRKVQVQENVVGVMPE